MRISGWSSDVCSSDLGRIGAFNAHNQRAAFLDGIDQIGRMGNTASGKGRYCGHACNQQAAYKTRDFHEVFLQEYWAGGARRQDRKSVVKGKSVSVRVDLGGRRILKKKK